jgi:hypothetical protein
MPALKKKNSRIAKLPYEYIPTGRRNVYRTRNKCAENTHKDTAKNGIALPRDAATNQLLD